jgi:hypothetical protein
MAIAARAAEVTGDLGVTKRHLGYSPRCPGCSMCSLKTKLTELAEREHRSLNREIEFMLDYCVREKSTKEVNRSRRSKVLDRNIR